MKIFLSTSFSSKVQPDGSVEPSFREGVEKIIAHLEGQGHNVYCGLREDNWRLNNTDPGRAFLADADAVKDCNMVVALSTNNPPSAGIQFELGMAHALQKPVVLLWQTEDVPVRYMNQGLLKNGRAVGSAYTALTDVPALLDKLLTQL